MTAKKSDDGISEPVDLTRNVYAAGSDFQLLCCQVARLGGNWVSAAELVYEFTGEPGSVVRNQITFELKPDERIEISLLDGSFQLFKKDKPSKVKGRKGIELLMKWKGMAYEEALKYILDKYSTEHASAMGFDYTTMKIEEMSGGNSTP